MNPAPFTEMLDNLVGPIRPIPEDSDDLAEQVLLDRQRTYSRSTGVRNPNGIDFKCVVVLATCPDSDALCLLAEGTHWIVINQELIDSLDALSRALFGNSGKESPQEQAVRTTKAAYFFQAALRFACDHEFFHAFHGHLLLVTELFERRDLAEPMGITAPREHSIRMALELEADRSAAIQQILEVVAGQTPGNDILDAMAPPDKIVLSLFAMALMMALWTRHDPARPFDPADVHPAMETRLFMLFEPILLRALQLAQLEPSTILHIHERVTDTLRALSPVHDVFQIFSRALDPVRRSYFQTENRRLELAYLLNVRPHLKRHNFHR
jgi:hypothetical protein